MKKFYAFVAAALMSASIFADQAAPTATDLAGLFDLQNNVVLCFQPIDEATVCRDIYFVGSPNNWGKGEGTAEAFANCEKFVELTAFPGWYAAELQYSEGFYGKPVHSTADGAWSWDYQCGDPESWVYVDGNQITLNPENTGESSMGYPSAGAYIYQLKYWKLHKNPCAAVVRHDYTITLYAPDACPEMKPGIAGDDMGWTAIAMTEDMDEEFNTIYTYSFNGQEGHGFKILDAALGWDNEMFYHDTINDEWIKFENIELKADSNIVLNWSDNELYRFAQCDGEEHVIYDDTDTVEISITLKAPAGAPEAGIEVAGNFASDDWSVFALMTPGADNVYTASIRATAAKLFKFREANSWDNEIVTVADGKGIKEVPFGSVWNEADHTIVMDYTDATKYVWKANWVAPSEGIENIVLTEKAQKVVVDGVLYIVRDNKMFSIQGAQVR